MIMSTIKILSIKMSSIPIIKGNILTVKTNDNSQIFICHQINCVTTYAAGLAKAIYDEYPETNIYKKGVNRKPGDCICSHTSDGKIIVQLAGQNKPGKYESVNNDKIKTAEMRLEWMQQALQKLSTLINEGEFEENNKHPNLFLFPAGMGCGLAGGNWSDYLKLIEEFAARHPNTTVKLVDFN